MATVRVDLSEFSSSLTSLAFRLLKFLQATVVKCYPLDCSTKDRKVCNCAMKFCCVEFSSVPSDGWILSDSSCALSLSVAAARRGSSTPHRGTVSVDPGSCAAWYFQSWKDPRLPEKADGGRSTWRVTTYCVAFAHWDCENGKLPMRAPET